MMEQDQEIKKLVEILNQKVNSNDKIITGHIDNIEQKHQQQIQEIEKKYSSISENPSYIKKTICASEKVKVLAQLRFAVLILGILCFFSPAYNFVVALIVAAVGIGYMGYIFVVVTKEEGRLVNLYGIEGSKMYNMMRNVGKKPVQQNSNTQPINNNVGGV